MRKLLALSFVFISFCLFLRDPRPGSAVSAQEDRSKVQNSDLQLARKIALLTDRSADGLATVQGPDGLLTMDLEGRFQNVMLSRIDLDGTPLAGCVTSLAEANEFFGRDLETGEPVSSARYKPTGTSIAERHGMSKTEFEFYTRLLAAVEAGESPTSATLTILNGDGAGEGFNDPTPVSPEGGNPGTTRGQQRLNLFNFAASIWGGFLDSTIATRINAQFNSLTPCSSGGGVLGSAGTATIHANFANAPFSSTWYHAALANKISGTDLSASADINTTFNSDVDNGCLGSGSRFYYGFDNATPANRVNLLVVLLHEMGHGLGFSSFVNGSTGALNGGLPDAYTRFLLDRTTGKYWHEMTNAERQASAINTGNVLWDGPNVKVASGYLTSGREVASGGVQLFTPNPLQSGSSISHFDSAIFPNLLMEPAINPGLPLNLDLTRQQMRDIGWYRDTNGDMVADTITNVLPSGGVAVIGSNATVTWTNTGGFNRNVTIELSTDGGATYPVAIATDVANTGSFNFVVPNLPTSQARVRVREHSFVNPVGLSASNFSISATGGGSGADFDYDGDGKTDVSAFRPSNGVWYLDRSSAGAAGFQWGTGTDRIVPADYDSDGRTDLAVYRPSEGRWYILHSSTSTFVTGQWGLATDVPAPADYDNDGRADMAIFRPSDGNWWINRTTAGTIVYQFGAAGDHPVVGDYDGDGSADIAAFRPTTGVWYVFRSTLGPIGYQFGLGTDKVVPADYDGDGKTDIAVYRPSEGKWYIANSGSATYPTYQFGVAADIPAPGDYDGDGRADIAVFRPSDGNWWLNRSTAGLIVQQFGQNGDRPTPNAYGN